MKSNDFSRTLDRLSDALERWSGKTTPVIRGNRFRLQGIDRSNRVVGLDDLFFVDAPDHFRPRPAMPMRFLNQEALNTGTLRNSFYPQILNAHCQIMDLSLHIRFRGRFQVTVYQSRNDEAPLALAETIVSAEEPESQNLDLGSLQHFPRGTRLFWVARALNDSCELLDVTWEATAPAASEGRMMVLIRTFGRTRDVQALLARLQDQAGDSAYGQMLANTFFLIYDASAGLTPDSYSEFAGHNHLNSFVISGPNLGGGGNMSLELLALQAAVAKAGIALNELVMTDDDLQISLESLARNWGATLFRKDNAFHTLPVFTLSDPRRMWEDGGFWGRYTHEKPGAMRAALAPRLLRHGKLFKGDAHLDEMARLHHAEYSTFIFLSMPYPRLAEIGLPAAFFLRGDDIEYNLRHAAAGGVTVSNPGMAAWHEPAHSYAQEYMSIAHGVIINMAYGQTRPDDLTAFFHARAQAHLALSDLAGLTVYAEVLSDLVSCDRLMQPNFASHYLAMIARFKSFDAAFTIMPDELVESLSKAAKTEGRQTAVVPFLYMPPTAGTAEISQVVLCNPHNDRRYLYDPREADRLAALATVAARLYAGLSAFTQRYDQLREHYMKRMAETAQPRFWQNLAQEAAFEVLHG